MTESLVAAIRLASDRLTMYKEDAASAKKVQVKPKKARKNKARTCGERAFMGDRDSLVVLHLQTQKPYGDTARA